MSRAPTTRNQKSMQHTVNTTSVQQLEISQGPLPHPSILGHYDQVLPGSAERLLRLVEKEADHRRALEKRQLTSQIVDKAYIQAIGRKCVIKQDQLVRVAPGAPETGGGSYTALQGAELPGALIGSGGVIGLVTVFIYGRKRL